MSDHRWTGAAFATVTVWGLLLGLALNSGPVLLLAFFCLLLWVWWSEPARYARWVSKSPGFRDKDRL